MGSQAGASITERVSGRPLGLPVGVQGAYQSWGRGTELCDVAPGEQAHTGV